MQVVGPLVAGQLVGAAAQAEPPQRDRVGVPADHRADVVGVFHVVGKRGEAEDDVARPTVAIRDVHREDDAAVFGEAYLHPARVGHREGQHATPVGRHAEPLAIDACAGAGPHGLGW